LRLALLLPAAAVVCALWPARLGGHVVDTRHNLSASGPGAVRAAEETQVCMFCHTPHASSPRGPLWNRQDPGTTYTPYSSSTALGLPGQPTGSSLLCLSCHDGTIALGEVLSRPSPITLSGGVTTIPSGPGRLGTDLSDDHPVSFAYTPSLAAARGELADPATLSGPIKLDASGQLQCTACHDPHEDTLGSFLRATTSASALCTTCHLKNGWGPATHRSSAATWNGATPDPWPHTPWTTVADNACENCHRPHTAGGRRWLVNYAAEEDNCYACHNAHVAAKNVQAEFAKASRHPLGSTTGVHEPLEAVVAATRHAECVDCHNPHAARAGGGTPPGPLTGVRGVSASGATLEAVRSEYEVCFRCHGDSPGKPAPRTTRQLAQTNVRMEFDLANPSYHPVEGPGRSANVPSLIAPLTTASVIACSDCHNSNAGPNAGGAGPNGPHGSNYAPLLERSYVTTDNTSESAFNYALCYKCHSQTSILGDQSFLRHRRHLEFVRAPCNVCHDPHGISLTQGNAVNNAALINFDTSVVFPSASGLLRFESQGLFRGRCYLTCHGRNHDPLSY
jgi:predicted CXXCH cytochrome family protein